MRVLVIGCGGREHALVWKLSQSKSVRHIFCAPGNGGIRDVATCVPIPATDTKKLLQFALDNEIDLTVVGPEGPLVGGIADVFQNNGLMIFGPSKEAAQLEGSKKFAKEFMNKYRIPTAKAKYFTTSSEAKAYVKSQMFPVVIKADGLAQGKGVVVAYTLKEADEAITNMLEEHQFGSAGNEILIEEFLEGQEISLMAFVDGKSIKPMRIVQDHKRIYDNDKGPNTGGMGAFTPVPGISEKIINEILSTIFIPIVHNLREENIYYKGVLYAGIMLTYQGPKVIEFNTRFGDPETQVVLPLLETDLLDICLSTVKGELYTQQISWKNQASLCVVMASKGYPASFEKGEEISIPRGSKKQMVFHAGTICTQGKLLTNGGRVLGITSVGNNLEEARNSAYELVEQISFHNQYFRNDIGRTRRDMVCLQKL